MYSASFRLFSRPLLPSRIFIFDTLSLYIYHNIPRRLSGTVELIHMIFTRWHVWCILHKLRTHARILTEDEIRKKGFITFAKKKRPELLSNVARTRARLAEKLPLPGIQLLRISGSSSRTRCGLSSNLMFYMVETHSFMHSHHTHFNRHQSPSASSHLWPLASWTYNTHTLIK